ncbi:hypothetical protein GJ496_006826 [Pomphorhynchus laevis]|nr:hypothetical protein GJ496_006826 [Pomphorhynchus laevis]
MSNREFPRESLKRLVRHLPGDIAVQSGSITQSRASYVAPSEDEEFHDFGSDNNTLVPNPSVAEDPSSIQVFDVSICSPQPKLKKRSFPDVADDMKRNKPDAITDNHYGELSYSFAEIQEITDRLTKDGNYVHIDSISGAYAVAWKPDQTVSCAGTWFQDLIMIMRQAGTEILVDETLNAAVRYHYFTAMTGNTTNFIQETLNVILAHERKSEVGDYRIEFRSGPILKSDLLDHFGTFYRGNSVDADAVSNEIQIQLHVSRRLAQTLMPVITAGIGANSTTSFYAAFWLLYCHRLFYLVNDQVPVFTAIAMDRLEWLNIDVDDSKNSATVQRILNAIDNNRLILRAERYSMMELAIIRLISNGLPRFKATANTKHVFLLDNTFTPAIPILVLGHGAKPDLPKEIPTTLDIFTTILKVANECDDLDQCYHGLVRACCTAIRFRAGADNNTLLDGFLQYRRTCWINPVFRNPFIDYLRLSNNDLDVKYSQDINGFIEGSTEEQFYRVILTASVVSTAVSTIFHRWSFNSNLIQMSYNHHGYNRFAAAINFFQKRTNASPGRKACNLMTLASMLINDLCYSTLPMSAFEVLSWNGAHREPILPIADNSGWLAGWPRQIPYPVPPQAVLSFYKQWPTVWGYLGMPVTYTVGREIVSESNINEAWVDITHGDDIILRSATQKHWFASTGYTTAVLNALSQHCLVAAWNAPNCYLMGKDGSAEDALSDLDIIPSFDYNAASRLFTVGAIWHFCWSHFTPIGIRWRRDRLASLVRAIFTSTAVRPLVAGVSRPGSLVTAMINEENAVILDEEFIEQ